MKNRKINYAENIGFSDIALKHRGHTCYSVSIYQACIGLVSKRTE